MTTIAVLVPTWRRPDDLARCLHALRDQRRRPDRVLVVRRPEDDESEQVLAATNGALPLEDVLVHESGQVAALNAGLEHVTQDVVAITDDDAAPWPNWVEQIGSYFDRDPALGALGGRDWVYHDGRLQDGSRKTVGRVTSYGRFLSFHHLGGGVAREVDFLKGANMSFRRQAIGSLRFDETLRGGATEYLNDWAFSLAVKRAGWTIKYDPKIAVDHHEAERPDSDRRSVGGVRDRNDRRVAADRAFNETYIAVRHLPGRLVAAHLMYVLLFGTTAAPGPGLGVLRVRQLGGPGTAVAEVRNSFRARVGGATAGFRNRLDDLRDRRAR